MADFKIYVEGKADEKFIKDLIQHLFNTKFNDVKAIGGKDAIHLFASFLKQNTAKGEKNILIFDANGDIERRREEISRKAGELGLTIDDLFLLPNNAEGGNLENLLMNLVNSGFNSFFDCFESYRTCLRADNRYNIPDEKTKMYAYTFSILPENKTELANETKRDYLIEGHWNLNHEYLQPLKLFLGKFFTH